MKKLPVRLATKGVVSFIFLNLLVFMALSTVSCQSNKPSTVATTTVPAPAEGAGEERPTSADGQIEVAIEDFAFSPETIEVPAGATILWRNNDQVIHTATAYDGSFDSGDLARGDTYSFIFLKKGTYEYYCRPHPFMKGKIIVE